SEYISASSAPKNATDATSADLPIMEGAAMVVTPLYAGLLALWLLVLAMRVIHYRSATRIYLGDGGNPSLLRATRGQANFVEYVPIALLLLAILETRHFSIYLLHA